MEPATEATRTTDVAGSSYALLVAEANADVRPFDERHGLVAAALLMRFTKHT